MAQISDFLNIVDDSKSIKDSAELRKLTPLEHKQLDYLVKEYPMLDLMCLESVLRLTDGQREKIVDEIKVGDLCHEKPEEPEKYIIEAVKVSD